MDADAYKALEENEEVAAQKVLAAALHKKNKRPITTFGKIRKSSTKKRLAINSKQKGAISKKTKATKSSSLASEGGSASARNEPKEKERTEMEVAQQTSEAGKPTSPAVEDPDTLCAGSNSKSNENAKSSRKKCKMSRAALKQSKQEAKQRRDEKKANRDTDTNVSDSSGQPIRPFAKKPRKGEGGSASNSKGAKTSRK